MTAKAPNMPKTGTNVYLQALHALRGTLGWVILFSALINVLMLTGSIYMLQVYDRVLSSGSVPTLMVLFAIVVVLFVFLGLYDFLRSRLLSRAGLKLDDTMSTVAFRRWLKTGFLDTAPSHDEFVMQDLETVRGFLSGPVVAVVADLLFVPLFLAILFMIHPWLGLLTIAGAALGGLVALVNWRMTRAPISDSAALSKTEHNFAEHVRNHAECSHAMGMTHALSENWRVLHDANLARSQQGSDPSELLAASSRAFRMLLQSAMLTLGAFLVLRGEISAGMIIASSILSGRAMGPIDQLVGQWRTAERFAVAHKRLIKIFDTPEVAPNRLDLPAPTGQISVKGLTKLGAALQTGERPKILLDVDFDLKPGDALGIIGSSASGKTTLARLLVNASKIDAGEIRLDGATPDQWEPEKLGRSIGYLPQTLTMLPGTVRDNIARFSNDANDDNVIAAAKLADIHDMILKLPEGYATQLGDPNKPAPLSGGQMQRLGLARVVYGMPKLIVLDEPNANLDLEGDAALTRAIETLRAAGSTVIVMAHRPSVLLAVNKLMILQDGMVQAFGDRDEILDKGYEAAPVGMPVDAPVKDQTATFTHDTIDAAGAAKHAKKKANTSVHRFPVPANAPGVVQHAGPANKRRRA